MLSTTVIGLLGLLGAVSATYDAGAEDACAFIRKTVQTTVTVTVGPDGSSPYVKSYTPSAGPKYDGKWDDEDEVVASTSGYGYGGHKHEYDGDYEIPASSSGYPYGGKNHDGEKNGGGYVKVSSSSSGYAYGGKETGKYSYVPSSATSVSAKAYYGHDTPQSSAKPYYGKASSSSPDDDEAAPLSLTSAGHPGGFPGGFSSRWLNSSTTAKTSSQSLSVSKLSTSSLGVSSPVASSSGPSSSSFSSWSSSGSSSSSASDSSSASSVLTSATLSSSSAESSSSSITSSAISSSESASSSSLVTSFTSSIESSSTVSSATSSGSPPPPPPPCAVPGNAVPNGGFESGFDLAPWVLTSAGDFVSSGSRLNADPQEGIFAYSALPFSNDAQVVLTQTGVPIASGAMVACRAYGRSITSGSNGASVSFSIAIDGVPCGALTQPAQPDSSANPWQLFGTNIEVVGDTHIVTVTVTATSLNGVGGTGGQFLLDNISVTPIDAQGSTPLCPQD